MTTITTADINATTLYGDIVLLSLVYKYKVGGIPRKTPADSALNNKI